MTTKYGDKVEDWNAAREEMRHVLAERAKLRVVIPSSELVGGIVHRVGCR